MRIARHHRRRIGDLHLAEDRERPLLDLSALRAAQREDLSHLRADADRRVERGARVLVHHRDVLLAQPAALGARAANGVAPSDLDLARSDAAVARQVSHDRERSRRLPAPRLADQPVGLPAANLERDAPQDLPIPPPHAVEHVEVAHVERRGARSLRLGDLRRMGAHWSNTCCSPSAMRFTPTTSVAIAPAGNSTVQE
jgi:hypothetical protein